MTYITKRRSLRKNCVEPYPVNIPGVQGLSPGLPSRKVWLSFQTNKQSGLNGTPLPDATPLDIKLQVTVSPSILVLNPHPNPCPLSPGECNQP